MFLGHKFMIVTSKPDLNGVPFRFVARFVHVLVSCVITPVPH